MLTVFLPLLFMLYLPISPYSFPLILPLLLSFISLCTLPFIFQPFSSYTLMNTFFMLDQMSSLLLILSMWISIFMMLSSTNFMISSPRSFPLTIITLLIILIMSFSLSNFLNFYIMFEASLIPTLLLILMWGYQPERLQAGLYLLLYTISASLPLLVSLLLLYYLNGTLFILFLKPNAFILPMPLNTMFWLFAILAFLTKLPMYTTHLWLPKAHVEAPVAGSMILAGLLLKLGGYGLLRLSSFSLPSMYSLNAPLGSLAMSGGVVASFICLRQNDIKSLIAYSSVGHMALIIAATSLSSLWGWQSSFTMMITHGLCSSALFMLANMTYEFSNTRNMFLTKGILNISPLMTFWWFLFLITNSSAPPSTNLLAEIALSFSIFWASYAYLPLLMMMLFLSVTYSFILFSSLNHGKPNPVLNPMSMLPSPKYNSLFFFHGMPLLLFIMKPELIILPF